jgi:phage shock protein E
MLEFIKKLVGHGLDLPQKMKEGAVIVDVRSPDEYAAGHVKGSKNIPMGKIESKLEAIKKWDKPVITCCASGMRSGTVASLLKRNGVEAYNAGPWQKVDRLTK